MTVDIKPSWKKILETEFTKPYFLALRDFVDQEYAEHQCYPPKEAIFTAFAQCEVEDVKVVILGQDPYHGPKQANGLCFAVNPGVPHPPSLKNIFKELATDIPVPHKREGDLLSWAAQGVLLLNTTLTVREGQAGSHQHKGWEKFTDAVVHHLAARKDQLVFLLWGGAAHKKGRKIAQKSHLILKSGHPSPLSANRGYWFGNKHFSKTNSFLIQHGIAPIDW